MHLFKRTPFRITVILSIGTASLCAVAGIPVHEVVKDVTGADIGTLTVGGAIRANYVIKDIHDDADGPSRALDHGGNMELDTFRVNADWKKGNMSAKGEYRWYDGYNFIHTAWLGYNFSEESQLQVGINRVPFGLGDYGPTQSWFFDLNFYVGLSDDMDVGLKWTKASGNFTFDLAAYACEEPNGNGATDHSARYAYDIVNTGSAHGKYKERGQLNGRVCYKMAGEKVTSTVGASLQVANLEGSGSADNATAIAAALHSSSSCGPWTLMLQLTGYDYGTSFNSAGVSDDLVDMGAYDWAAPVASRGVIPSASLAYTLKVDRYSWIDSITFYGEGSMLSKTGKDDAGNDLNDSAMATLGAAFAMGGWYTYVEYCSANGNFFVSPGHVGVNAADEWQGRFNINFGYYF